MTLFYKVINKQIKIPQNSTFYLLNFFCIILLNWSNIFTYLNLIKKSNPKNNRSIVSQINALLASVPVMNL